MFSHQKCSKVAKVSANSPESMFSDESKVFRVLVYKPCTRYFVSQSIIRGNKTADKEDDADDCDDADANDDDADDDDDGDACRCCREFSAEL